MGGAAHQAPLLLLPTIAMPASPIGWQVGASTRRGGAATMAERAAPRRTEAVREQMCTSPADFSHVHRSPEAFKFGAATSTVSMLCCGKGQGGCVTLLASALKSRSRRWRSQCHLQVPTTCVLCVGAVQKYKVGRRA